VTRILRSALPRALLAVIGLSVVAILVRDAGPERVGRVMWQAGSWLPAILALELLQLFSDFVALRQLLGRGWSKVSAATWVRSSAVAYAMMILLPAGRAAGEITRATLVAAHIGAPRAATASTQLQAVYLWANGVLSAAAWAVAASRFGIGAPLSLLLAGNVVAQTAIAGGLLAILWDARVGRWLERTRRKLARTQGEPPAPLDPSVGRMLPWRAAIVCTVARGAQVLQYGVILRAVGGVPTVRGAFIAHGIHLIGTTLGDMLPNQVGVVDGAYRAFARDVGFGDAPERALSIAFVARVAQLIVAGACVVVASLYRRTQSSEPAAPASTGADVRS